MISMAKIRRIADLDISDDYKRILSQLNNPRNTAGICAKLGLGYSTVSQRLSILKEMGYVRKIKTMTGKVLWQLKDLEV